MTDDTTQVSLDLTKLTIGELSRLESATGQTFDQLITSMQKGGVPSAKLLAGLAWVIRHRQQPGITLEDAADSMTVEELVAALEAGTEEVEADPPATAPHGGLSSVG